MDTVPQKAAKGSHRTLHFTSIDQVLNEVEQLVEAEQNGILICSGNWSLGRILGHLGTWAEFAFDGTPLKPPFFIRWILKARKKQFFVGPMPRGVKIPRVAGGTLGSAPMALDAGNSKFRAAFQRLRDQAPVEPHNIFGPLTHDQWIRLNLRHAELHLGYTFYAPATAA